MSQNDLVIDNQSFPATRSDINSALQALGSLSSGSSAPATTYANMLWYDTINNTLKMRSEANDQWISVAYVDQSADAFRILDDTQVVNTSGTQTGLLGDQATATWEAGIGTAESLVSPAKVKAAIDALVPAASDNFGVNQTWQDLAGSRSIGVNYQAPLTQAIQVDTSYRTTTVGSATSVFFEVSPDQITWVTLEEKTSQFFEGVTSQASDTAKYVIPAANYYRVRSTSGGAIDRWYEMR